MRFFKKNKDKNLITSSPKKKKKGMFSPTGVREDNNEHKKKIPLIRNKSLSDVQKYLAQDCYNFNFFKLLELEYDMNEFDPYLFIATLPEHKPFQSNFCVPKKAKNAPRKTIVLDLDETLVHCATYGMKNYDLIFPVVFNGIEYKVYVKKRPFFQEFLEYCAKEFEVIVFTASHKTYANKLLDMVDKDRKLIHHRVFRDSCVQVDGNYLKDLTILGREMKDTFIVDNSPTAFGYHVDYGIPIVSWYDNMEDKELIKLIPTLKKLAQVDDVSGYIKDKFKFNDIITKYRKKFGLNKK